MNYQTQIPIDEDFREHLADLCASLVSQYAWHPIAEGLPEVNDKDYREVIITDGEKRSIGIYMKGRDYISPANSKLKPSEVTHYMYYPKLPTDA